MKKALLIFAVALLAINLSFAQTPPVWSEDFSNGSNGWTVKTTLCGNITGPAIGQWELSSATLNGAAIPGLQATFSVNTAREYSVRFNDGTNRGEAQARYTLTNNVWESNLNGVTIPLNAVDFLYTPADQETPRFTSLNMSQAAFDSWGRTMLGMGQPTTTIAGNTLTITSANSSVVLTFNRTSTCGSLWWWTPNGNVGAGALVGATTAITSPTAANGSMIMNSDYFTTQGLSANVPSGPPPYPQYTTELISPVIDLSDYEFGMSLQFYQLVRFLNPSSDAPATGLRTSFAISTDGGETWGSPINVNDGLAVNATPLNVQRLFALPGVQGQANVRIKFTWSADFYYWVLDDIAIVEQPRYDMRVNTNFFTIAPNFATPVGQLEPMYFLADIENVGGRTSTNVNLNLSITNAATMDTVYNGNVFYGDIPSGVIAENYIFPTNLDPAELSIGTFNGTYSVTLDSTDLFPSNNVINWQFVVTDSLFSKEGARTRGIAPAAEPSFTYGNIYYTPNGNDHFARFISFGVTNANQLTNRSVTTLLYRWQDTNENGTAEPAEYGGAPIAFNSYTFTGTEGNNFITIPVDLDENPVALEDGYHYIAAVQYFTDDAQSLFLGGNGVLNYSSMVYLTDSLNQPRFNTALVVGQNSNPSFSTVGFGYGLVPQVRLSIGDNSDLTGPAFTVSSTPQVIKENLMKVFPNPATDMVNVQLLLNEAQDVNMTIFDLQGRVVARRDFEKVSNEIITLPVNELPAGTYYIRLATPKGINVQPVVVGK